MSLRLTCQFFKPNNLLNYTKRRNIFNVIGALSPELNNNVMKEIETYWKDKINVECSQEKKEKYYVLSMFPYPSGQLHMGHVRVYTISDAIARFNRMCGKDVIHPIGWDAFGLPAENAAIDRNIHPAEWTAKNIETMKEHLKALNLSFDWDSELSTCDSTYYKWTQYLFLKLYENDLAYKKRAIVNWDPIDETVLADEQVDENGCSWRSGCKVEKRLLTQWFLRTTAFAKDLYEGLNSSELENWRDVTKVQQHWIGECDGYTFYVTLVHRGEELPDTLAVWTDTPELMFGSAFISITPEHPLNSETYGGGQKSGIQRLDLEVSHPLTGNLVPVFVTSKIQHPKATDAFLGIPSLTDEEAFGFALQNNLDIIPVFDSKSQVLINSEEFSRMSRTDAKTKIVEKIRNSGIRVYQTSKTLRDWLISRQRYWGVPIPIINCPTCKTVPVPVEELPVVLPHVEDFSKKSNLLSTVKDWFNVKCPKCGGDATRETDTMDTFVDSSWYFLRYLDNSNSNEIFRCQKVNDLMPVDVYIGGKEHAALHLFYARFMSYFCHSIGLLEQPEPFKQLLMQGMIHGQSFQLKDKGKYITKDNVNFSVNPPVEKGTNAPLTVTWEKMSKSKFNGVDPETVLNDYGIDTTRLFILFSVAPQSPRKWNEELFPGILNWQKRIWVVTLLYLQQKMNKSETMDLDTEKVKKLEKTLIDAENKCIEQVTRNFHVTRQLNVCIACLQSLTNELRKVPDAFVGNAAYEEALSSLLVMLAPLAPHFASELWSSFSSVATESKKYDLSKPVFHQTWPKLSETPRALLYVKVNSSTFTVLYMEKEEFEDLNKETALQLAFANEKVQCRTKDLKMNDIRFKKESDQQAELNFVHVFTKKENSSKKKKKEKAA